MEHTSKVDVNAHLRVVLGGLGTITFLMGGMIGLMAVLVYDGMYAAMANKPLADNDFDGFISHAAPVIFLSYLAVGLFFAMWYRRYAKRVRQDPSQMIEL